MYIKERENPKPHTLNGTTPMSITLSLSLFFQLKEVLFFLEGTDGSSSYYRHAYSYSM